MQMVSLSKCIYFCYIVWLLHLQTAQFLLASGGVSSIEDVKSLSEMGIYGAIIGKAYYTGAIDLGEAITLAEGGES